MNAALDWQQLAAAVAVLTGVVGGLAGAARLLLGRARMIFTPVAHHAALVERVARVEETLKLAPTSADMSALTARVANVETGVAVSKETLNGVSAGITRVEKMVDMLVQHQLKKDEVA